MKTDKYFWILLSSFVIIAFCEPSYAQFIDPAPPLQMPDQVAPQSPVNINHMCIPLQFQLPRLDTLESFICPYINGHVDLDQVPYLGSVSFDYELWRAPHFDVLQLNNNTLSVASTLYYYARFSKPVSAQCGWQDEDTEQLTIGFDAKIGVDTDYSLQVAVTPRPIVNPTKCILTIAQYDATPAMNRYISQYMGGRVTIFSKR